MLKSSFEEISKRPEHFQDRFSIGAVQFDYFEGLATTVSRMSKLRGAQMSPLICMITPSEFFRMVSADISDYQQDEFYQLEIRKGSAIAPPYLKISFAQDIPNVYGHEGRHRMATISTILGADTPIPVQIQPEPPTNLNILPFDAVEKLRGAIRAQKNVLITGPVLPEFWLRNRCYINQHACANERAPRVDLN